MTIGTASLRNVSSSQLEMFRLCRRKWWLHKVAHLRPPREHYFLVGDRLHQVADRFLTGEELHPPGFAEGLQPQERKWLVEVTSQAVADGVWQRRLGGRVEVPFCFLVGRNLAKYGMPLIGKAEEVLDEKGERYVARPTELEDGSPLPPGAHDLPYLSGFLDYYVPSAAYLPPLIEDHKTAKNRRYGKRQKDIPTATQLLIYACLPFAEYPWLDETQVAYNVFLKDLEETDKVYRVEGRISRRAAAKHWDMVVQDVEQMVALVDQVPQTWSRTDPGRAREFGQVPGDLNPKACDAYGGCPYKDLCFNRCSAEQLAHRFVDLEVRQQGGIKLNLGVQ